MNKIIFLHFFLLLFPVSAIINGFEANPLDLLSTVSILSRFSDSITDHTVVCSGALIAPNIVLSAAHCIFEDNSLATVVKVTTRDYNLFEKDNGEKVYFSHAFIVHPEYKKSTDPNTDIGIIFLSPPSDVCSTNPLSPRVARLPPTKFLKFQRSEDSEFSNQQIEKAMCYTSGWGRTENGSYSQIARQMLTSLKVKKHHGKRIILAKGLVPDSRACMGDSGAPVFCYLNGRRYMTGILTEIATFGNKTSMKFRDQLSMCRQFQYSIVADWRESSRAVHDLLVNYHQLFQLKNGQKLCNYLN